MEGGGFFDLVKFIQSLVVMESFVDILLCAVPIWLVVMINLLISWSWRPRWTGLVYLGLRSKFRFLLAAAEVPPVFGAHRLWLAFTALSAFSVMRTLWSYLRGKLKESEGASSGSSFGSSDAKRDALDFLVTVMGLIVPWSATLATVDVYCVLVKRPPRLAGIVTLIVIGDWILSLLSLAAATSAASVAQWLFSSGVVYPSYCAMKICTGYPLSASMAFWSWILSLASSLFNIWALPRL